VIDFVVERIQRGFISGVFFLLDIRCKSNIKYTYETRYRHNQNQARVFAQAQGHCCFAARNYACCLRATDRCRIATDHHTGKAQAMNRSHVIRLNATPEQDIYFRKACSRCGWIHDELTLAERVYFCQDCGLVIDRDHNAAINIRKEALRMISGVPVVASSERKIACGAERSGPAMDETVCCEAGTKVL
jgi:hypothetical protein